MPVEAGWKIVSHPHKIKFGAFGGQVPVLISVDINELFKISLYIGKGTSAKLVS